MEATCIRRQPRYESNLDVEVAGVMRVGLIGKWLEHRNSLRWNSLGDVCILENQSERVFRGFATCKKSSTGEMAATRKHG
jgi:hypothetical protein